MKAKVRWLGVLLVCLSIPFVIFGCSGSGTDSKGRPEISSGDKALAMMEVQNVFSKHAYYHQVGKYCEELEDIWVREDGPNAATCTWINGGKLQNYEQIKLNYCTNFTERQKQTLTELSKIVPSIEDIPENLGAGGEYVMHTQETPVIEVAGDGKTAKGIWYSIGLAVRGSVAQDGTTSSNTQWMWEKYAVDFIKEDGEWKIWHLQNIMDEAPSSEGAGAGGPGGAPGGQGGGPGGQGGEPPEGGMPDGARGGEQPQGASAGTGAGGQQLAAEKTVEVFKWSPTVVPRIEPRFPEPYYTFSETFSY